MTETEGGGGKIKDVREDITGGERRADIKKKCNERGTIMIKKVNTKEKIRRGKFSRFEEEGGRIKYVRENSVEGR